MKKLIMPILGQSDKISSCSCQNLNFTISEFRSCGTNYPAWLDGKHPTAEEGVVTRKIQLTNDKNYKWG